VEVVEAEVNRGDGRCDRAMDALQCDFAGQRGVLTINERWCAEEQGFHPEEEVLMKLRLSTVGRGVQQLIDA